MDGPHDISHRSRPVMERYRARTTGKSTLAPHAGAWPLLNQPAARLPSLATNNEAYYDTLVRGQETRDLLAVEEPFPITALRRTDSSVGYLSNFGFFIGANLQAAASRILRTLSHRMTTMFRPSSNRYGAPPKVFTPLARWTRGSKQSSSPHGAASASRRGTIGFALHASSRRAPTCSRSVVRRSCRA